MATRLLWGFSAWIFLENMLQLSRHFSVHIERILKNKLLFAYIEIKI